MRTFYWTCVHPLIAGSNRDLLAPSVQRMPKTADLHRDSRGRSTASPPREFKGVDGRPLETMTLGVESAGVSPSPIAIQRPNDPAQCGSSKVVWRIGQRRPQEMEQSDSPACDILRTEHRDVDCLRTRTGTTGWQIERCPSASTSISPNPRFRVKPTWQTEREPERALKEPL